jgi:hypothetical protein
MKKILLLMLLISGSMSLVAQQKLTYEQNKKQTEISESTEKSKTVTFPIKATKTTDPNYENNLQKSKETQSNLDREPIVVVKDDKYYTDQITELKRRIQEIHDNPNSPNVNADKLGGLTDKLSSLEQEYIEFKKSK